MREFECQIPFNRSCSILLHHCEVGAKDSRLPIMGQLESRHLLSLLLSWMSCFLKQMNLTPHPCPGSPAPPRSYIDCSIVPAASCTPLPSHSAGMDHPQGTKEADWGPPTSSCRGGIACQRSKTHLSVHLVSGTARPVPPQASGQFSAGPNWDTSAFALINTTRLVVKLWEQTGRSQRDWLWNDTNQCTITLLSVLLTLKITEYCVMQLLHTITRSLSLLTIHLLRYFVAQISGKLKSQYECVQC